MSFLNHCLFFCCVTEFNVIMFSCSTKNLQNHFRRFRLYNGGRNTMTLINSYIEVTEMQSTYCFICSFIHSFLFIWSQYCQAIVSIPCKDTIQTMFCFIRKLRSLYYLRLNSMVHSTWVKYYLVSMDFGSHAFICPNTLQDV